MIGAKFVIQSSLCLSSSQEYRSCSFNKLVQYSNLIFMKRGVSLFNEQNFIIF